MTTPLGDTITPLPVDAVVALPLVFVQMMLTSTPSNLVDGFVFWTRAGVGSGVGVGVGVGAIIGGKVSVMASRTSSMIVSLT